MKSGEKGQIWILDLKGITADSGGHIDTRRNSTPCRMFLSFRYV